MRIKEVAIDTPTVRRLKGRGPAEYLFAIGEQELHQLRNAGLPPSAIVAYTAIRSAIKASGLEWASVPHRTFKAFNFPPDWWRTNVRRLEKSGLIECDRQPGRLRRYRLSGACVDDRYASWLKSL